MVMTGYRVHNHALTTGHKQDKGSGSSPLSTMCETTRGTLRSVPGYQNKTPVTSCNESRGPMEGQGPAACDVEGGTERAGLVHSGGQKVNGDLDDDLQGLFQPKPFHVSISFYENLEDS